MADGLDLLFKLNAMNQQMKAAKMQEAQWQNQLQQQQQAQMNADRTYNRLMQKDQLANLVTQHANQFNQRYNENVPDILDAYKGDKAGFMGAIGQLASGQEGVPENYLKDAGDLYNDVYGDPNRSVAQRLLQLNRGKTIDLADPVSGEVVQSYEVSASPTSEQYGRQKALSYEKDLRKEFQALPQVKTYEELSPQYDRVVAAMDRLYNQPEKEQNWVAVDQTLITILNKMLDPDSVVRESEYERTPLNISLLNRFRGMVDKWTTGGAGLTNKDRDEIAYMAGQFFDIAKQKYDAESRWYGSVAQQAGINPDRIIRNYSGKAPEYKPRGGAGGTPKAELKKIDQDAFNQAKEALGDVKNELPDSAYDEWFKANGYEVL